MNLKMANNFYATIFSFKTSKNRKKIRQKSVDFSEKECIIATQERKRKKKGVKIYE